MSFAHLHLHTEFSMLDGLGRINDYMARALQHGMRHIAITDHGVMYGVLDFYKAARANNLQPVIGVEGYLAPHGVADRDKPTYHLLLLAETDVGYHNLIKLSSRASLEGFYRRPRMDFDMLAAHSQGLICTTAWKRQQPPSGRHTALTLGMEHCRCWRRSASRHTPPSSQLSNEPGRQSR